jgi:ABC-2 type transport system permease protein
VIRAFGGELFKTVRRPAVWVCVVGLMAVAVTIGYGIPWLVETYAKVPAGSSSGLPPGTTLADLKVALYPANLVRQTLQQWSVLGGVFALIVGVLLQGSEYGWGTVKTLFTQRDGRLAMLTGKVAALAVVVIVLVVGLFVTDAVSSVAAALLDGKSLAFPDGNTIAKGLAALFLIFGFWAVFGFGLATLFRQSAMAIGLGLAYALVIEGVIFGLAGTFAPDTVNPIRQWFPVTNSGYLADAFGQTTIRGVRAAASAPYASATHAVIVLFLYVVGFLALSVVLVRRRDVTS